MTIEEVKRKQRELETRILKEVQDFYRETGLAITSLDLHHNDMMSKSVAQPVAVIARIELQ